MGKLILKVSFFFLFIFCYDFNLAQKINEKTLSEIDKILISKIKEESDSLIKKDIYINKHNLKPMYVLYMNNLEENKKSFTFAISTILNHYEIKMINPSHILYFSNQIVLIRYNHKTINSNLIDGIFNKIYESDIKSLIQSLKSISGGGGGVVGPRKAVIYTCKNKKYTELWYDDKYNIPVDFDFIDYENAKILNDSIMRMDSINKKHR